MNNPNNPCRNGHFNSAEARFCVTCGDSLLSQRVPAEAGIPFAAEVVQQPTSGCPACELSFEKGLVVCSTCSAIKPIAAGHRADPSLFQWKLDGQAMSKLRSIKPLVMMAQQVSSRIGKPWIEANFQGIRLGPRQMPEVYAMATQAARILGLQRMPNIYVSGARPWDALTFGSDDDAFIVIGSALVSCFQKSDLMFIFAREMGHILAGHALWKTVIQFLVGEQRTGSGMMKNGIAGLMDPARLIEGAIELPLINWARQAEITADRAGLLASSGIEQARRVLMVWSLKSPVLLRQINIEAWLEQQSQDTEDENIRLAEVVSSATPYLTRRVKLLQDYNQSLVVQQFRQQVMGSLRSKSTAKSTTSDATTTKSPPAASNDAPGTLETNETQTVRFRCPHCQKPNAVPVPNANQKSEIAVKCANDQCNRIMLLKAPPAGVPEKTSQTLSAAEQLSQMV